MAALNQTRIGVVKLGLRPYVEMSRIQERLVESRRQGKNGDLLLILEHPPTYTQGRRSEPGDLLQTPDHFAKRGIEVCETPRGGKVTYHGPGQLVIYPIVDLRGIGEQPAGNDRIDVANFVALLETAMTRALARWQIVSAPIEGLTGLWVSSGEEIPENADAGGMAAVVAAGRVRKIGSIGLRISRGISSHGLALNISCDLTPFDGINSCGIEHCRVASMKLQNGSAPSIEEVGMSVCAELADLLERDLVNLDAPSIGLGTAVSATA